MLGILKGMQLVDAIALVLLASGACALALGCASLAQARDLLAMYWLALGVCSLRTAARISRRSAAR
jgi:hypothetical protein